MSQKYEGNETKYERQYEKDTAKSSLSFCCLFRLSYFISIISFQPIQTITARKEMASTKTVIPRPFRAVIVWIIGWVF